MNLFFKLAIIDVVDFAGNPRAAGNPRDSELWRIPLPSFVFLFLILACSQASAIEIESFTQPYQIIDIPASEMGVLAEMSVREGDIVEKDQVVAKMHDQILQASRAIAEARVQATSDRQAAQAEKSLAEQQLKSYRELFSSGNATQRELDRAETSFWQATTRMQAVDEEQQARQLEHKRILVQLERRLIRSTIDGVVASVSKDAGEFVSPTDPIVLQVVQLDQLKAVFSVPLTQVDRWQVGKTIGVLVGRRSQPTVGTIQTISPVADAESGSVRVTVAMDNREGGLRSGVVCRWDLEANDSVLRSALRSKDSNRSDRR